MGDITITSNRSEFVDFTLPYTELGVGVVVKLSKDPWFFLKPLKADLWITFGCFFFLTGITVWLFEHRINEEFQGPPARQIGTAMWFAVSTLVYAHSKLSILLLSILKQNSLFLYFTFLLYYSKITSKHSRFISGHKAYNCTSFRNGVLMFTIFLMLSSKMHFHMFVIYSEELRTQSSMTISFFFLP